MEACSVARIMSLQHLALGVLPKLLALSPTLLHKFRSDPPPMETETVVGNFLPDLPQDVLMDIFALLEIPDLVRAGAVCSSWRSAYTSLRSLGQYKPSQMPCLLYTSESAGENVACLYSLAEKRVYKLIVPDPPIRSRYLLGSSHGWLVTADERSELHLLNPITGQQIALPSVITMELVKPIFDDAGAINKYELWTPRYRRDLDFEDFELIGHEISIHALDQLRDCVYIKASVFPDPSTRSYIVVLLHNPEWQLSFARPGDCKWTLLPPGSGYLDFIYMDGLLYAFTATRIDVFDLIGPTVTRNIILDSMKNYKPHNVHVVQAPWGDMLKIYRRKEFEADDLVTNKFLFYKVDMAAKELVETDGRLHDHVLFLGLSQSQCLSAEEYPQLKANHVYFTDNSATAEYKNDRPDTGVLNLENDSREEIVSQLWCSWPNPIWITPNLTMMNLGL